MSIREESQSIAAAVSRTPSDFRPSDHFIQMKRDRSIPGGAIRECIENGEVREAKEDCIRLTAIHNDEQFTLVVNPEEGRVVTGYRERAHFDQAKDRKWEP